MFNGERRRQRGDLKAVIRAILLDPEARGDVKTDPSYGRLRHPAQFIVNILRAFNAKSADGSLDERRLPESRRASPWAWTCSVRHRSSATSRRSTGVPGGGGLRGPEFGLFSTSTALARLNFVNTIVFSTGLPWAPMRLPVRRSTCRRCSRLRPAPAIWSTRSMSCSCTARCPSEMRNSIVGAVTAVPAAANALKRVRTAVYLVADVIAVSGGEVAMHVTRREFLLQTGQACLGYALGAAAFAAGVERFGLINAFAQGSDYRALVCVFLAGGNDGNNMVVPASTTEYNAYAAVRSASGSGDRRSTRCCRSRRPQSAAPSDCIRASRRCRPCGTISKLSVVCNVGPLVQPLTRATTRAARRGRISSSRTPTRSRSGSPPSPIASRRPDGAGRTADRFGRTSVWLPDDHGAVGRALHARPDDRAAVDRRGTHGAEPGARAERLRHRAPTRLARRHVDGVPAHDRRRATCWSSAASRTVQQALDIGQTLNSDVTLATVFPEHDARQPAEAGRQGDQVQRLLAGARTQPPDLLLPARRLRYAPGSGGDAGEPADAGEPGDQGVLRRHGRARAGASGHHIHAVGLRSHIPAGRNGRRLVGTDHAWGNHHFVVGGAVRGGDFYGVAGPNGTVFPVLQLGGPSDTDNRGRWIPTASVEQYAATLASWYGVSAADLPLVFPNIGRFPTADLGFMS